MNRYKTNISLLIAFTFTAMTSLATIITVKQDGTGDYTTIQAGIDAAATSDTVLVWPGIYYENPVCNSKTIVLASLYITTSDDWYRYNTVIDGNQNGSCMEILGVVNSMEFCGFTLTNGSGHLYGTSYILGGGIYIKDSSPAVKGCIIYGNSSWSGGGLIIWTEGDVFLSGNTIKYNYAMDGGGGIHITHASSVLFDPVYKNSIFLNHGGYGCDIHKTSGAPALTIPVDTFTISNPDYHFIASHDQYGFPVNDIYITIETAMIQPVDADIYVSPYGEDSNSGLSPSEPLKTIWYAFKKIEPDTVEQRTIHLLPGTYSPSSNGEMLPVVMRSYTSLKGASKENTIIDAEFQSNFIRAHNLTNTVVFSDFALINASYYIGSSQYDNIFIRYSDNITFRDIIISGSRAKAMSGISFEFSTNTSIDNCLFENNLGRALGLGEVDPVVGYFLVKNTVIRNNDPPPDYGGGGIFIIGDFSPPATSFGNIVNSQITGNNAWPDPSWGGAKGNAIVNFQHNKVNLVNSSIGDNVTKVSFGVAVNAEEGAVLNVYNSILYGDSLREISLGSPLGQNHPATLNMAYSDIEGGEDDIININNQNTINWLSGNIDADPLWEETGDHPYALKAGSPCINTGTPMYEPGMQPPYIIQQDTVYKLITLDYDTIPMPSTDLAGNPRIAYGRIDMGAYEFADTTTQITNHQSPITNHQVTVFPNPFTSNAFISFQTNTKGKVCTAIYNLNGQLVKKLTETEAVPGSYSITWDGTDSFGFELAPGTYLIKVILNGKIASTGKVIKKQ